MSRYICAHCGGRLAVAITEQTTTHTIYGIDRETGQLHDPQRHQGGVEFRLTLDCESGCDPALIGHSADELVFGRQGKEA